MYTRKINTYNQKKYLNKHNKYTQHKSIHIINTIKLI